jgi:hypothetical protein
MKHKGAILGAVIGVVLSVLVTIVETHYRFLGLAGIPIYSVGCLDVLPGAAIGATIGFFSGSLANAVEQPLAKILCWTITGAIIGLGIGFNELYLAAPIIGAIAGTVGASWAEDVDFGESLKVLLVLAAIGLIVHIPTWWRNIIEEARRQAALAPIATAAKATSEVERATAQVVRATTQVVRATTEAIQAATEAAQVTATARVLLRKLDLERGYCCQEASYSPDGTKLAISGARELFIWDLAEEGHVVRTLTFDEALQDDRTWSTETIGGVSYSPDGRSVAAIGKSGVVKIWDTQTWRTLRVLAVDPDGRGLMDPKLVFSPDGQRVVTWSSSFKAMVWDTDTGEQALTLSYGNRIDDLAYSLDGQSILTVGNSALRVWDAHTGEEIDVRTPGGTRVAYSADGHRIVVTNRYDGTATIWDADIWKSELTIRYGDYGLEYATLSPDNHHLLTIREKDATMRDATTGQEIATLTHDDVIQFALYSPDGRHIVTLNRCWVMIWDAIVLQQGGVFHAEYN